MREQATKLSRGHDLAKAIQYILKRRPAFTLFLDDGRVCMSNNAAERGLRGVALGRKSRLFCGSDRGGRRAADMYSLIVTAKINGVDPQAWRADVLSRIAAHPAHRLDELLPTCLAACAWPWATDSWGSNLYKLWNRMSSGSYFPPPVKAVPMPKKSGGVRVLGIPTVSDRIAQTAVKMGLEPRLDPIFHGSRPPGNLPRLRAERRSESRGSDSDGRFLSN